MPDLALAARPPLTPAVGRFGNPSEAGVALAETSGRGLAGIIARNGRAAELGRGIRTAFGADLPMTPRRRAGNGVAFLWTGPEQWLALFDQPPQGGVEAALRAACDGLAFVTDLSDSRANIRVSGPKARAALAKGLPIDLHERVFKVDDVAATILWHIPVLIVQLDDAPTYEMFVPRSFAESFWHWLTQSCAEFGYEVTASGN